MGSAQLGDCPDCMMRSEILTDTVETTGTECPMHSGGDTAAVSTKQKLVS